MQLVGHHMMTLICGPFLVVSEAAACPRPRACPSAEIAVPGSVMAPRRADRAVPRAAGWATTNGGASAAPGACLYVATHGGHTDLSAEAGAVRSATRGDLGHRVSASSPSVDRRSRGTPPSQGCGGRPFSRCWGRGCRLPDG